MRQSPQWREVRHQAIERDSECVSCGKDTDLQVHHIIRVADGGGHNLENLVTVCNDCHWSIHNNGPVAGKYPPSLAGEDPGPEQDGFENQDLTLTQSEMAVLEAVFERGQAKREEIVNAVEYTEGTVGRVLRGLRLAGWVTREKRGVYRYDASQEPSQAKLL